MQLHVSNLVIEVTRMCNLHCEHCLRGDAQDVSITDGVMREILSQVDSVGCVTFTGGEPGYACGAIDKFLTWCEQEDKVPEYFWVATNGMVNNRQLAMVLLSHWPLMGCPEESRVAVSRDRFHDNDIDPREDFISGLSFVSGEKAMSSKDDGWVLDRGNANLNGIGRNHRAYRLEPEIDDVSDDLEQVSVDMVYVSADGKVCWDCDLPYDDIDESGIRIEGLKAYLGDYAKNMEV